MTVGVPVPPGGNGLGGGGLGVGGEWMVLASLSRSLPSDVVETRCVFRARLNSCLPDELFLSKNESRLGFV